MKKILLFDADGTLFDFDAAEHAALEKLIDYAQIKDKDTALQAYHRINSALWKQVEQQTMTQSRLKLQRFVEFKEEMKLKESAEELSDYYTARLAEGVQLIPYAYETLEILSKKYDCHIITNGITQIQKNRFARSSIQDFIKELFISEEMGVSKPDVRYFDHVKEKLNTTPDDQLIVIGDSLSSDMQGALNANLQCIWYNPKHLPQPSHMKLDAVIDDLRNLANVIESL